MRTWGSEALVADAHASEAHFEALKARWPEARSAYVPSGVLPLGGVVALLGGGVIATVAATLTGVVAAAISLALFTAMGFFIALIAACGFVACVTLIWGLGIALVGGGVTFGGLGWVAGALTAWFGKLGKNRNVHAPVVIGMLATFAAWAALASIPPALALLVPPSTEDFSLGGIVHLFGDYGWLHAVVWIVGLAFALLLCFVGAEEAVKAQKFCEPCGEYQRETKLCGASLAVGEQLQRALAARDVPTVASLLGTDSGADLEPTLHACPRCGAGYLEARLWARTKWREAKGDKDAERSWLALSVSLRPEEALPLSRLPPRAE